MSGPRTSAVVACPRVADYGTPADPGAPGDWDRRTETDKLAVVRSVATGAWTDPDRLLAWRRSVCRKHAARRTTADRRLLRVAFEPPPGGGAVGAADGAVGAVAPFLCREYYHHREDAPRALQAQRAQQRACICLTAFAAAAVAVLCWWIVTRERRGGD